MNTLKAGFLIFAMFILLSCSDAGTEEQKKDDADVSEIETVETAEAPNLQTAFPQVFRYLSSQDTSFDAANFTPAEEAVMDSGAISAVNEEELKPYLPYLVYNKDRSLAVDLYSYNVILDNRNGKTVAEAAGPDTEAALIDFKNKTRKRLLFGGPSMAVLDAQWLGDGTILIAGAEIINDEQLKPILWKIEPSANKTETFYYTDTLTAQLRDYKDERLPTQ